MIEIGVFISGFTQWDGHRHWLRLPYPELLLLDLTQRGVAWRQRATPGVAWLTSFSPCSSKQGFQEVVWASESISRERHLVVITGYKKRELALAHFPAHWANSSCYVYQLASLPFSCGHFPSPFHTCSLFSSLFWELTNRRPGPGSHANTFSLVVL